MVAVDVGGDAIADGGEPGLGSPLCDAVMIAGAQRAGGAADGVLVVIGAGCDGELTTGEVLDRVAALAAARAWIGSFSVRAEGADELESAARLAGTEASMQVVRCARGETGTTEIRGGRRTVALGPLGAIAFGFDLPLAAASLPLVGAVAGTETLEGARDALVALGARTELDYERDARRGPLSRAAGEPAGEQPLTSPGVGLGRDRVAELHGAARER